MGAGAEFELPVIAGGGGGLEFELLEQVDTAEIQRAGRIGGAGGQDVDLAAAGIDMGVPVPPGVAAGDPGAGGGGAAAAGPAFFTG